MAALALFIFFGIFVGPTLFLVGATFGVVRAIGVVVFLIFVGLLLVGRIVIAG